MTQGVNLERYFTITMKQLWNYAAFDTYSEIQTKAQSIRKLFHGKCPRSLSVLH